MVCMDAWLTGSSSYVNHACIWPGRDAAASGGHAASRVGAAVGCHHQQGEKGHGRSPQRRGVDAARTLKSWNTPQRGPGRGRDISRKRAGPIRCGKRVPGKAAQAPRAERVRAMTAAVAAVGSVQGPLAEGGSQQRTGKGGLKWAPVTGAGSPVGLHTVGQWRRTAVGGGPLALAWARQRASGGRRLAPRAGRHCKR